MDNLCQQLDAPHIMTLIGSRIEYLSEFDVNEDGTKKTSAGVAVWLKGFVSKRRQCYKAGETVEVLWDEIPDADMPVSQTQEPFDPQK
jgi:hypothetical protein